MKFIKTLKTVFVFIWGGTSKQEENGSNLFDPENVTKESSKTLLQYYAFPKLRD